MICEKTIWEKNLDLNKWKYCPPGYNIQVNFEKKNFLGQHTVGKTSFYIDYFLIPWNEDVTRHLQDETFATCGIGIFRKSWLWIFKWNPRTPTRTHYNAQYDFYYFFIACIQTVS